MNHFLKLFLFVTFILMGLTPNQIFAGKVTRFVDKHPFFNSIKLSHPDEAIRYSTS